MLWDIKFLFYGSCYFALYWVVLLLIHTKCSIEETDDCWSYMYCYTSIPCVLALNSWELLYLSCYGVVSCCIILWQYRYRKLLAQLCTYCWPCLLYVLFHHRGCWFKDAVTVLYGIFLWPCFWALCFKYWCYGHLKIFAC